MSASNSDSSQNVLGVCDDTFAFDACSILACCKYISVSHVHLVLFAIIFGLGVLLAVMYCLSIRHVFARKVTKPHDAERRTESTAPCTGPEQPPPRGPTKHDVLLSEHMKNVLKAKGVTLTCPLPNQYAWQTFEWSTVQNVPKGVAPSPSSKSKITGQPKQDKCMVSQHLIAGKSVASKQRQQEKSTASQGQKGKSAASQRPKSTKQAASMKSTKSGGKSAADVDASLISYR